MPVYFIQVGDDGPVKIGRAADPEERLRGLQTAHHEDLRLLRTIEGDAQTERWLHRHYSKQRIRGEWFEFSWDMSTILPTFFEEEGEIQQLNGFGEYLAKANMTRAAFAEKVGVTPSMITRLIDGSRLPSYDLLSKISKATGKKVGVGDFENGEE